MVQDVVKFAEVDFKKRNDKLTEEKIKLENEIEDIEDEKLRLLNNVEKFRYL